MKTAEKDINYWRNNAEENYPETPISVLKYISELENSLQPRWIPVSESLPEEEGQYLCWDEYHKYSCIRCYNSFYECWDDEDGDDHYCKAIGGKITAWQFLPEPYKP